MAVEGVKLARPVIVPVCTLPDENARLEACKGPEALSHQKGNCLAFLPVIATCES